MTDKDVTKQMLSLKKIEDLDKYIAKYRPSHKIYVKFITIPKVKCGKTHNELAKIFKVERRIIGR